MNPLDLDDDGKISEDEVKIHKRRISTQRWMASGAMFTMIIVAIYLAIFSPLERIEVLTGALTFFWAAMAGVVATYMGAEAYVSGKK